MMEEHEKNKKQYSKKHFYAYQYENDAEDMTVEDYYEEMYTQPGSARQARKTHRESKKRYMMDFY